MEWVENNWELITTIATFALSVTSFLIFFFRSRKALKTAKTDEERTEIKNAIKSATYGLITTAENLFSDIPKSGASKLLYVLNGVKELCLMNEVEYNAEEWTEFINNVIGTSNEVIDSKVYEGKKNDTIEAIKREIPYYIEDTDKLFENIPNSLDYRVEHVLKSVLIACDKFEVNVFNEFDWRGYIKGIYAEKGVA